MSPHDDRIEKTIELKAPVARVWRALTDHREFGEWFRVKLEGPFVPGQATRGQITYPGYEHLRWEATVQKMEPERLFSFTWHPYAVEPGEDYSSEPPTLVEFTLETTAAGTRSRVIESGFDKIPASASRRGVPHERGRLERAGEEHRDGMSPCRRSSCDRIEGARVGVRRARRRDAAVACSPGCRRRAALDRPADGGHA